MKIIFTAKDAKEREGKTITRHLLLISFANLRVLCGKAFDWQTK